MVAGDITLLPAIGPRPSAARYSVAGPTSGAFTISLPNSIKITNAAGSDMIVNNFTKGIGVVVFNSTGHYYFSVGATLNLSAKQPSGVYTGTYNVTVSQN